MTLRNLIYAFVVAAAIFSVDAFANCNSVVAADGAGDVKTIQEAVDRVPAGNRQRCVIRIRPGTYVEQVRVPENKPYVSFIGENGNTTKLTYSISNQEAGSTSAAYATYIGGHDFYAENITFENSFGTGSQAVAVLVEADRAVFKNCRFLGWQDTLYAKNGRQYYIDSYIEGHVDYIFGQAAAVFENCHIHSKGDGYVTAPMRFAANESAGFVFNKCRITSSNTKNGIYLGRPWRDYGRTVFLNTAMDAHIRPEGWHHWEPHREKTAYFAEYGSTGKGAGESTRVGWARKLSDSDVKQFSVEYFLSGRDGWDPYKQDNFEWQEKTKPDLSLVSWNVVLKQSKLWYAVDEATRIANQVLMYQRDNGGWEKNVDMAAMLTQSERQKLLAAKPTTNTTIDNGATTTQLHYLAKVITAKNIEAHKEGFFKGLDYLFAMQYENGGFPQYYPLRQNYSRHITFNDSAMINVLLLLRDIAKKNEHFLFVDEARRLKAEKAIDIAIPLIVKTQVVVPGQKTIWAQQYEEVKLKPAWARSYEPPCLTAGESVGVVKFLMLDESPSPEVIDAIESAVRWFESNKIIGYRWNRQMMPEGWKHGLVKDANAGPIWARFYQIETMKPIFLGRDGVIKYDISEIDAERGGGYAWYVDGPRDLVDKDYPKWKQKLAAK